MRQTGEGFKLPDITSSVKSQDTHDRDVETYKSTKLYIPTMKIFSEDSPVSAYGENGLINQLPLLGHSDGQLVSKNAGINQHNFSKEQNIASLQSHFNYEHFTGDKKKNIPSQPDLIKLLSDAKQDSRKVRGNGDHNESVSDKTKSKKEICANCRMADGKHKHWCIIYLENQKAMDNVIFADRGSKKDRKKRVSFGEIGHHDIYTNETGRKSNTLPIPKSPKMIRSSTTLDGLNRKTDHPDFSSLHREVYIQALAESRARRMTKLKTAYNFTTQSTRPFLFSYFDNLTGPSNRLRENKYDGMKHILGRVKVDKYYDRLTGKIGKGVHK